MLYFLHILPPKSTILSEGHTWYFFSKIFTSCKEVCYDEPAQRKGENSILCAARFIILLYNLLTIFLIVRFDLKILVKCVL